jgi:hypothetical protein
MFRYESLSERQQALGHDSLVVNQHILKYVRYHGIHQHRNPVACRLVGRASARFTFVSALSRSTPSPESVCDTLWELMGSPEGGWGVLAGVGRRRCTVIADLGYAH